ncbi:glypican-5 [Cricetulus griseus]|nr:glypican-5 [Cricetulus griseus]
MPKDTICYSTYFVFSNTICLDMTLDHILFQLVNKICGHPVRTATQSPRCTFDPRKEKHGMKVSAGNGEETLANRRKEFINSLRLHRSFYGGLADQLCITELAAAEGRPCWNGEDVVQSINVLFSNS